MQLMTRAEILGFDDLKTQDVSVPEWGDGTVRLRMLTAAERDEFDASLSTGVGTDRTMDLHNLRARLLSLCIVDTDNQPLFSHDDVVALGGKSSAALGVLFVAAQELNGLTPSAVKDAVKN